MVISDTIMIFLIALVNCHFFDKNRDGACTQPLQKAFIAEKIRRLRLSATLFLKNVLINFGKLIGSLWPSNNSSLFLFFPFYHVGGAEKVHADIVACVADRQPWVFITQDSLNDKFRFLFEEHAKITDISRFTRNKLLFYIYLGVLAHVINRKKDAVVFGGNSYIFYCLLPYLKPHIKCIDLLHAFGGGVEDLSLHYVARLDRRVVITQNTLTLLREQYISHGVDESYLGRVTLIQNKVDVPNNYPEKPIKNCLRVVYVGRGTEEKRVHLIARAAFECQEKQIPVEFVLIGDVIGSVEEKFRTCCKFEGEIANLSEINKFLVESDIIVLVSSREGFPVVIMEAMAYGVVPVSTSVGGISTHVRHGENGYLITTKSEDEIVNSLVEIIRDLVSNSTVLRSLSLNAYEYAKRNFNNATFCQSYRRLLIGEHLAKSTFRRKS